MTAWEMTDDPREVYKVVQTLFDGTHAGFDVGGYCYVYPNNNGIAMYMYYLLKAGITTMGLRYLNVVYWMVSMLLMYRILRLMGVRGGVCALATIAVSLCIPYGMYVTYVYGEIPGIMLVLASFYFLVKWCKSTDNAALAPRWSFLCIWASIMCMALACVLKQNYLIMAVSLAICMVAMFARRRRWLMLVYCIVLFVGYAGGVGLVNAAIEGVTGLKVGDGLPRLSWVAMGLRWVEEDWPGGFDGWPRWAYNKVGYDNEKMEQYSREEVKRRMEYYLSNKRKGVRFFYKKINLQWNEPTYGCFYVIGGRESHWEGGSRLAGIMGEGSFVRVAYEWLANEMQTMLWLGIVLFILLCHKKVDVVCLFAATGFVGGFMFHMVWEVAPRYAITYVVLLIPYAVIGFVECAKWLDGKWRMAWGKLIRS
jgi:hypothetical protein